MLKQPMLDIERACTRAVHESTLTRSGHYAMARNDDGQGVGAAGLAKRAWCGLYFLGKLAIGASCADGDIAQCLPDALLKCSSCRM